MDNDSELFKFIKREYQLRHSKEEALDNICCEYDLKTQTWETIQEWSRIEERPKPFRSNIQQHYIQMLTAITSGYLVFQKAIYFDPDYEPLEVMATCSRYGFKTENNDERHLESITIFDHFHGKKENFTFADQPLQGQDGQPYFELFCINIDYLLVFETAYDEVFPCRFHLIKIDWEEKKCRVLCHTDSTFHNGQIYLDRAEREKFAILIYDNNPTDDEDRFMVYEAHATPTEITLKHSPYRTKRSTQCRGYTQNKLFGIDLEEDDHHGYAQCFKYWELSLLDGSTPLEFEFECDFDVKEAKLWLGEYTWQGNSCYLIVNTDQKVHFSQILHLNLDTRKCTFLDLCLQEVKYKSCFMNMDANQVLSIQCNGAAYRFSMNQPESLQNLCWFAIRRHTLLTDDQKYYEDAVERLNLDSKFREFRN